MKRLDNPLDLHDVGELAILADIVDAIRSNAPDEPLLLIGAFARDVLLEKGLGIRVSRATRDIDLAIAARHRDVDPGFQGSHGDNELMAAWLLGRHMGELLAAPGGHPAAASPTLPHPRDQLLMLLGRETDPQGQLCLAAEMDHASFEKNIALLRRVRTGLES